MIKTLPELIPDTWVLSVVHKLERKLPLNFSELRLVRVLHGPCEPSSKLFKGFRV